MFVNLNVNNLLVYVRDAINCRSPIDCRLYLRLGACVDGFIMRRGIRYYLSYKGRAGFVLPLVIAGIGLFSMVAFAFFNWVGLQAQIQRQEHFGAIAKGYARYGVLEAVGRLQTLLGPDRRATMWRQLNDTGELVLEVLEDRGTFFEPQPRKIGEIEPVIHTFPEGEVRVWVEPLSRDSKGSKRPLGLLTDNVVGGWLIDLNEALGVAFESDYKGRPIFIEETPEGMIYGPLWDVAYDALHKREEGSLVQGYGPAAPRGSFDQPHAGFPFETVFDQWLKASPYEEIEYLGERPRGDPVMSPIAPEVEAVGVDFKVSLEKTLIYVGSNLDIPTYQPYVTPVPWVRVFNPHEQALPEATYLLTAELTDMMKPSLEQWQEDAKWQPLQKVSPQEESFKNPQGEGFSIERKAAFGPGESLTWAQPQKRISIGGVILETDLRPLRLIVQQESIEGKKKRGLKEEQAFAIKKLSFEWVAGPGQVAPLNRVWVVKDERLDKRIGDVFQLMDKPEARHGVSIAIPLVKPPAVLLKQPTETLHSPIGLADVRWHPRIAFRALGEGARLEGLLRAQWMRPKTDGALEAFDAGLFLNRAFFDHTYAAAHIAVGSPFYVEAPFNVNEVRVEAWEGFLESLNLGLTAGQVRSLALALSDEVKRRRPFCAVSAFINRRLEDGPEGEMGALIAALKASGCGLEAQVFLDKAGPRLQVREDAFMIHADVVLYKSSLSFKAEKLVQRSPLYVDRADDKVLRYHQLKEPLNRVFGRLFRVR